MTRLTLATCTIAIFCMSLLSPAQAKTTSDARLPVLGFVSESSVLVSYYRDFADRYPIDSPSEQMTQFFGLLRESDLLADRLSMLGGKPSEMHAILTELAEFNFSQPSRLSKEERDRIRSLLLGLDVQLESIESSLSSGTRSEFRREVLEVIPPLNRVG
jgi:hypothetical protein